MSILTSALKPILRWTLVFFVTGVILDVMCAGERLSGDYVASKIPYALGLGTALGLLEAYRARRRR